MIEAPKRLRMEGTYLNIIKTTYNKPIANIMINGDKAFALISGTTIFLLNIPIQYST